MAMRINQVRSQDDHSVEYYGRQQNPVSAAGPFGSRRGWGVNSGVDDSVLGDVRGMAHQISDLESRMHSMDLTGRENMHPSKKMWSMDDSTKPDARGFTGWGARDDSSNSWGSAPPGMSQTGNLGVNMVEFVLGGASPINRNNPQDRNRLTGTFGPSQEVDEKKETTPSPFEDGERREDKELQANVIMQNGLEDGGFRSGSRQNSPNAVDLNPVLRPENDFLDNPGLGQPGFPLDSAAFGPMVLDPMSLDYNSQVMPSVDSPNFSMDYNQMMQRQQQPLTMLTQQQYAQLAQQQQQMGLSPLPGPFVISAQEPYPMAGIPLAAGPTMIPASQYPYLQTHPWGLYTPNILQQGGQTQQPPAQMLRGQGARPLTPSQQGETLGTPTPPHINTQGLQPQNAATGPYQLMAPTYMVDQNGQLVLGGTRNMGLRLVSPSLLVPAAAGPSPQGGTNNLAQSPLRLLTTQTQQVGTPPAMTNAVNSSANNSAMGFSPTSSLGYTAVTPSMFPPVTTNLGMQNGFGSNALGQLNSSTPGTIGQNRDSFDVKRQQLGTMGGYYGGVLGNLAPSPAGTGSLLQAGPPMTPPPTLSGASSTLSINQCGATRPYSAAPGAEGKYRGNLMSPNGFYPPAASLFPTRNLAPRSASMSKEVSGRSRLLEDFRNNHIPNLQLKDLSNHVVEFSQDQHGSRFIQQKLERATEQEKARVFTEILGAAYSLMTDVFGNYVIQKFFEFGTPDQKQTLAQRVRGRVLPLALQMYGCRVIQKALESIPVEMQVELVKELEGHVLKCVRDQNGNHVVQKCIECVDPKYLNFIVDSFKGNVYDLSTHAYGCRVIQRILEHCSPEQTSVVLGEMHQHTERLVQDQFGNYVIQHVLEHGHPEDKSKIVACIRGKVLAYSQHKYASNVVEKCVSHSSRQEKGMLIEEILTQGDGHHGAVFTMIQDQFANYVLQKMIDVAEPAQRRLLMYKIRPHIATLRKYNYGKHILTKLEKYLTKTVPEMPNMA